MLKSMMAINSLVVSGESRACLQAGNKPICLTSESITGGKRVYLRNDCTAIHAMPTGMREETMESMVKNSGME